MARRTSRRRTSRKLGTGSRFSALVRKLSARGDIADPRALAAAIGRRKYGSRRFQQLAASGRRRSSLRRNSRRAPKFKVGDKVQGMSGRMKLFGPQRVAAALYDSDAEEWTYYLPETRHTWVEGMLRPAKATPRRRTSR